MRQTGRLGCLGSLMGLASNICNEWCAVQFGSSYFAIQVSNLEKDKGPPFLMSIRVHPSQQKPGAVFKRLEFA